MIDWEKLNKLNLTAEEKLIVIYVALNPGTSIELMAPTLNVGNLIPYIENLKSKILEEIFIEGEKTFFLKENIVSFSPKEVKNMIVDIVGEIEQNIAMYFEAIQQKNTIPQKNTILHKRIPQKNTISDIANPSQPLSDFIPQDVVIEEGIPQENTMSENTIPDSKKNTDIFININKTNNKKINKQIQNKTNNKKTNTNKTNNKREYSDDFEEFWKLYPRKIDKYLAYTCWEHRLKEGIPPNNLILACKNYARAKIGEDMKFILHPATFLGPNRRWETYLEDYYEGRAGRKYSEEELEEKLK
jgi:hypothetical protein